MFFLRLNLYEYEGIFHEYFYILKIKLVELPLVKLLYQILLLKCNQLIKLFCLYHIVIKPYI